MTLLTCKKCGKSFNVKPYRAKTAKFCSKRCAGKGVSLGKRFWGKVDIKGRDKCWLWKKSLTSTGYGQIMINKVPVKAHRVAYYLRYGNIPKGMCILHSCDTPKCCNPRHLRAGTQKENMQDMVKRGRQGDILHPCGEKHPNSKLRTKDVIYIRSTNGIRSDSDMAREYNVTPQAVWQIRKGVRWAHV